MEADAQAVDRYIPDDLVLVADRTTNTTALIVQIFECTDVLVEGHPAPTAIAGEIIAVVEKGPAGDCEGTDTYSLPAPCDSEELHSRYAQLSVGAGFSPHDDEFAFERREQDTIEVRATVPDYSLQVSAAPLGATDEGPGEGCCVWKLGHRGYVGGSVVLDNGVINFGPGSVDAVAGSPLADMIGDAPVSGVAAARSFDVELFFQLVAPDREC